MPTAVKKLRGNPGKRALNEAEPKFGATGGGGDVGPYAPRRMPDDGKRFWRKYARALELAGVLKEPDLPAFEMMAWHFHFAVAAGAEIERDGLTQIDKNGDERKHPLLQVFKDNSGAFRIYASEFGMTPSSRTRVKADQEGDQLSLAEILFKEVDEQVTKLDGD